MKSLLLRTVAILTSAVIGLGLVTITTVPAEAARHSCSVKNHLWTNAWNEIINEARVSCVGVKKFKVVSKLYYCTWYEGDHRAYRLKDSTTKTFGSSGRAIYREVAVVEAARWGRWIGTSTVYYKVGKTSMSKGDSQYGPVGITEPDSTCNPRS